MRRERSAGTVVRVLPGLGLLVALALFSCAVGAAHGQALPPCQAEGYGLEQTPAVSSRRDPGTVLITAGWLVGKQRRHTCALRTTVRVTIVGAGGVVALRARWRANTVLEPWSAAVHTWAWRNWCASDAEPRIAFADANGKHVQQLVPHPPTCVNADDPPTVTSLGDGTKHVPRPGDPIPPRILTRSEPPPFPPSLIAVEDGMVAGDGHTLVAVYAGSPGNDPASGRLVVLRQNVLFGVSYLPPDTIDVGKVGPLKITTLPPGGATSAQHGAVGFVSANGTRGVLDLKSDLVQLKRRG